MMLKSSVSVVLTVFNKSQFIRETTESVLSQTFRNFELIIVDDASTDNSISQIDDLLDSRIQLYSLDVNMGVEFARNFGAKLAKSNFLVFLDGDDLFAPTKLEKQVQLFESRPELAICGTWALHVSESGHNLGDFRPPVHNDQIKYSLHFENPFINSSVMVRRELFESADGFLEGMDKGFAEDYELWLRLTELGQAHNLPSMLTVYRDSKNGRSQNHRSNPTESSKEIRRKYLQTKLGSSYDRNLINNLLNIMDHTIATPRISLSDIRMVNAYYSEIENRISENLDIKQIKYQKHHYRTRLFTGMIFHAAPIFMIEKYSSFKSFIKRSNLLRRLKTRSSNLARALSGQRL